MTVLGLESVTRVGTEGGVIRALESYAEAPPSGPWTDTDFININAGGNYDTVSAYSNTDLWDVSVPGQIRETFGHGWTASMRHDESSTTNQYLKLGILDFSVMGHALMSVCCSAAAQITDGYQANIDSGNVRWWYNGGYAGDYGMTALTGSGTLEISIVDRIATTYWNGGVINVKDFTGFTQLTGLHQGVGADGAITITSAEGGDYVPPPLVFSDDFNRADGSLGPNWVYANPSGWPTVSIVSNKAVFNGGHLGALTAAECTTGDQYVEADCTQITSGTMHLMVCGTENDTIEISGYALNWYQWDDRPQLTKAESTVHNFTNLLPGSGTVKLRLEKIGNVFEAFVNGVSAGSWTDTGTLLTGTRVGMCGGGSGETFDNFEGGDLVPSSGLAVSDNFNRPDTAALNLDNPHWSRSTQHGWPQFFIVNNEAVPDGYSKAMIWDEEPASNTDCFSEVDWWTGYGEVMGPIICHSGTLTDERPCYSLMCLFFHHSPALYRDGTQFITQWAITPAINAAPARWVKLRLSRSGNVLTAWVDGVAIGTYTDPTPLTGTKIGFGSFGDNGGQPRFDNWRGGDGDGT